MDVKTSLLDRAHQISEAADTAESEGSIASHQKQATCLTRVADNVFVSDDTSEARKSEIIDTVNIECAKWTPFDESQDLDGSSTWIKAITKVQTADNIKQRTIFDDFWEMTLD